MAWKRAKISKRGTFLGIAGSNETESANVLLVALTTSVVVCLGDCIWPSGSTPLLVLVPGSESPEAAGSGRS